jgi:splicing factor 3B subunit 3
LGVVFNQSIIPLTYTPRRFILHPATKNFVVIESDHATFSPEAKREGLIEKVRACIQNGNMQPNRVFTTSVLGTGRI